MNDHLEGVRRVALAIANQRAQQLRAIKYALAQNDEAAALKLMREFFEIDR